MGKPMYLSNNAAPGVVLGPSTGEGFNLYEPGMAPTMGGDMASAAPPGVVLDKGYDEIQAMAQPQSDWLDYLAAGAIGAGLLGGNQKKHQAPAPSGWRPSSLPPVAVGPSYSQGVHVPQLWEELIQRNGPLTKRLSYNFTKGGGA